MMPSRPYAVSPACALAGTLAAAAALSAAQPVPDELLTRAEHTGYRETSSYDDVMELSERLAALADDVHLTGFGYTNEGRRLPLVVVGAPDATPEAVRATGKTRVYLQGNIHGGEVCGKEALLMLLREWMTGGRPAWADELVLLVAPIYNADGNERVDLRNRPRQHGPMGGMGQRANAQGLDLNRDHMKLDSPEARSFVALLDTYDPHVTVDLHTTNGSYHAYHLTYAPPLHPNTPASIVTFLRERWLPEVTRAIRDRDGWELYYYGNVATRYATGRLLGRGWYTFDHRPRFNNNYVGLRNRMAILSEAYAYLSFEDRVRATRRFVEETLEFAGQNAAEIREIVERADEDVVGRRLATRARVERSEQEVTILMGEVADERHPYTGESILRRLDVATPTRMYEFGTFVPYTTEVAPAGYYVLPSAEAVIERLVAHGIRGERLTDARNVTAERFQIDSADVASAPFEGRIDHAVWGRWSPTNALLPTGTFHVPVDQPLGRLAFSLLEPQSDDGFVAWAFLEAEVEQRELPILREPAGP